MNSDIIFAIIGAAIILVVIANLRIIIELLWKLIGVLLTIGVIGATLYYSIQNSHSLATVLLIVCAGLVSISLVLSLFGLKSSNKPAIKRSEKDYSYSNTPKRKSYRCRKCYIEPGYQTCTACNGSGMLMPRGWVGEGNSLPCTGCNGTGHFSSRCEEYGCEGGYIYR